MFNKKIILILTILLVSLFAISSISAADNATSDVVSVDETTDDAINVDEAYEVVSAEDNQVIEQTENEETITATDDGNFTDLQNIISNAEEGSTITLDKNYCFTSGLTISNSMTIDGNDYIFNFNGNHMNIDSNHVILKNIIFKNSSQSAISFSGDYSVNIINCTFINCSRAISGGAIYIRDGNQVSYVTDCTFINCSAEGGGAIYSKCGEYDSSSKNVIVTGCNFFNCSSAQGGAIYFLESNGIVKSCNFENCSSTNGYGGAIYCYYFYTNISFSKFKNCFCKGNYGGAINLRGGDDNITECEFINCSATSHGGAVYIGNGVDISHITNCKFVNCSATKYGGALHVSNQGDNNHVNVDNCTFINCSANNGGASSSFSSTYGCTIKNSSFINCSATDYGGAVYFNYGDVSFSSFINCSADKGGAVYFSMYGRVNLTNFLICSAKYGGGVYYSQSSKSYLLNSYFDKNNATFGEHYYCKSGTLKTSNITCINLTSEISNTTKPTPEVVVPPLDKPSADGSVTITLPSDATGKVTLTINGKSYNYLVENGEANVIIPNLGDGDYPYTITYSGDSKYSSFTNNGRLKVNKSNVNPVENQTNSTVNPIDNKTDTDKNNTSQENTTVVDNSKIVASNINVVYSAGSYYTITVYGTDGKLANGESVKVTGKISKSLTTNNGVAKFKIDQVPGTYKITISALGKSVTKTITIKHLVTLKTVTVKKSAKKLVLQATLGKINGKYYTAKTNAKGVAKVTIKSGVLNKLKVGKKVTYQATYSKDTVKKTVKVKK